MIIIYIRELLIIPGKILKLCRILIFPKFSRHTNFDRNFHFRNRCDEVRELVGIDNENDRLSNVGRQSFPCQVSIIL